MLELKLNHARKRGPLEGNYHQPSSWPNITLRCYKYVWYVYRYFHYGDKTVAILSYIRNRNSYVDIKDLYIESGPWIPQNLTSEHARLLSIQLKQRCTGFVEGNLHWTHIKCVKQLLIHVLIGTYAIMEFPRDDNKGTDGTNQAI